MENVMRPIINIAVSTFAVIVGLKIWLTAEGFGLFLAMVIILIGISALESNVTSVLKGKYSHKRVNRREALPEKPELSDNI